MNGRERLLKTFRREKVDRVPISPFLYCNAVYEFFGYEPDIDNFCDPEDFDVVEKCFEYCDHFGFDYLTFLGHVWDFYAWSTYRDMTVTRAWDNWDVTIADERKGSAKRRTITIRTPEGELNHIEDYRKLSPYMMVWATEEYLIKTKEDFEIFRKYCPPQDTMDCRMVARAKEAIGDRGLVFAGTQGAFNTLNVFRKLDDIMMDPLLDEGFYREMIEFFLGWLIERVPKWVAAGADVIEIGANLAGGAVGPNFFEKYVLDYEQRLLQEIHRAGVFTGYHNCGDAASIMHLYNQMDIDYWGYLTPPPFGDVDLDEALRVIRPDMVLRGNIDQVEFLRKATPEEITARVRDLLLKVKPRGNWILSTTDFWIDSVPYENIRAFAEAGLEYGQY
jgi:uroporphyrinogen-III decarboxylase